MKKYLLTIIFSYTFFSFGFNFNTSQDIFYSNDSNWADSIFNTLKLDEKIAQLFMIAAYSNRGDQEVENISSLIKKYKIGGLIFFQGTPEKQIELTNQYQSLSKVPLLIATDAEWGIGMRLDNVISYPRQMTLGAIQDNHLIYEMGQDIASQLKRIGVHVNFAPVVDVNNNPKNPVINNRSFGEDKYNVANKGLAYSLGMQDNKIIAVAKHFPGHGDTDTDSHFDLPVITHSKERLDSIELFPFKHLINHGVKGIMTAHLSIPAFESKKNLSSSLSKNIIEGLLKKKLTFNGLIFTDALNMQGVSKYYEPGIVDLKAFKAGNDILLFSQDVPRAIKEIKKAIRKKEITIEEINTRCKKILEAKQWVGLNNYQSIEIRDIQKNLNKPDYQVLKRKLIESSLSLLGNKQNLIPFKRLDTLKIASIAIGADSQNVFQQTINLYTNVTCFNINKNALVSNFEQLSRSISSYNLVIISVHNTNNNPARKFGITNQTLNFINNLKNKHNTVLLVFANPYSLSYFNYLDDFAGVLLSYEDEDIFQDCSAQLLFGGIPAQGKLPVSINEQFKSGFGIINDKKNRLKYSIPEEVNLDSEKLNLIDSIALNAINKKATPGCQVLVARNGAVVYNKSFGYHTYLKRRPVLDSDIFDIASITKIAATVPSLMKLYEENKFKLDATLSDYFTNLDTTNKSNLVMVDILTHQARLNGWIPFYLSTFEPYFPEEKLIARNISNEYPFLIGNHTYFNKHYKFIDSLYSFTRTKDHSIEVARNLYIINSFLDTIFRKINSSELKENKEYLYSDLGFYYLKKIIEKITNTPIEKYVESNFYNLLVTKNITYRPLEKFNPEKIIPTENDIIFRKQLLHGHVHDPGAAMLGGVGGHAGLFANANDLAKLMQMFLNNGSYGGTSFFKDSTIQLFTSSPFLYNNNRRGIGFDKPETDTLKNGPTYKYISPNSYGHSGFTGTTVWVDPDYQIIYIFLSNRIHPDQNNRKLIEMNVRTNIQEIIYKSIIQE